jgi:rhamnulose-1-phosphate aldolase
MSYVYFPQIIRDIGGAGLQLTTLGATEGSAGNISVFVHELRNLDEHFARRGEIKLPAEAPQLAGAWIVATGSGRRLRDISSDPDQSVVAMQVHDHGRRATWYAAADIHPTSEWNSHLAVHADQVRRRDIQYHALVHAQPHFLTYLSHHPGYASSDALNDRLLRWEPETILTFPEGIGLIPFHVPGSVIQMQDTVSCLRVHRLVVWQRHGVMARSDTSASQAADLVEYGEVAARYEVLNLQLGTPASGLSDDDLRAVCAELHVPFPAILGRTHLRT